MLSRLPRSGFTLIELLLSVAVCMILLGGLYFAVDIQVRSTRTGREVVDEAMVARAVLDLIARDIESSITLNHPFKFRKGSATFGSITSSSSDTSGTSTDSSAASGSSGSSSTPASGSTGSRGSTDSSSTDSQESASGSVYLPPGVVGFPDSLNIYCRKSAVIDAKASLGAPVGQGDLRRICYYMARLGTPEEALVRYEVMQPLTPQGLDIGLMPQDDLAPVVAEEVRAVRFFFHAGPGGSWVEQWDSRSMDYDDLTPLGPPRAVRVEIDIEMTPRPGFDPVTHTYSRVVVIPVGNVPSIQTREESGS